MRDTSIIKRRVRPVNPINRGVKPTLTDDVLTKIKTLIFEGKTIHHIGKELSIPSSTIYTWKSDNYLGFSDKLVQWEMMKELEKAQEIGRKILSYNVVNEENGELNTKLISIQQREAEFVRSTAIIARKLYDKRDSGTQNGNVQVNIINYKEENPTIKVVSDEKAL